MPSFLSFNSKIVWKFQRLSDGVKVTIFSFEKRVGVVIGGAVLVGAVLLAFGFVVIVLVVVVWAVAEVLVVLVLVVEVELLVVVVVDSVASTLT